MDAYLQTFLQQFQHLKIQLEEVKSATNNFNDENCIGVGGFGKVYKGEVSHYKGRSMVAIKRLDVRHGQGTPEFLKEITTLSRYSHENLISILGFCYEEEEMILVYEHASRGSLDRHLNSPHLTWSQRVKICLDAAKGLNYLHDPRETHQRLIHCDIKSSNILLNDQWNAKISDFGLSIMAPANEQQSLIVTSAAGTPGYCDPQYVMTHTLTKESDVYSFGVVLFEVLCGRLCCTYSNGRVQQILVPRWIENYKQKKLNDIIFRNPSTQRMDQGSITIFSDIAYRCLMESREDRPKMAEVVAELEIALESQENIKRELPLFIYGEMARTAEPPLKYRSKAELKKLLYKGILLNNGKTWFSLNKKLEHCEMISCGECVDLSESESHTWSSEYNSSFAAGTDPSASGRFKAHVKSQFLSPRITYTVNLVFKFMRPKKVSKCHFTAFKYRLQGETESSTSYLAYEREDGCWMAELYQFTSDRRTVDLEILFDFSDHPFPVIQAEGIEFRPLEEDEKLDMQPVSDSDDANWEEKLPVDYKDIINRSKDSLQWTTKKDVYSIFCKGLLINDGEEWFSVDINGKKCLMLSARAACKDCQMWQFLPQSRFGGAIEVLERELKIIGNISYQVLSCEITYATYLVYKLSRDESEYEVPVKVKGRVLGLDGIWYFYLRCPETPVISMRPSIDRIITGNKQNRPRRKGVPQLRDDGWMEVLIWEFRTSTSSSTTQMIPVRLKLTTCSNTVIGLIVEGVEFRPA